MFSRLPEESLGLTAAFECCWTDPIVYMTNHQSDESAFPMGQGDIVQSITPIDWTFVALHPKSCVRGTSANAQLLLDSNQKLALKLMKFF
jgi:hypothetical protein